LYDSEESSDRAGFAADARAGFHWISLKQRGSSEIKRNLERIVEEVDDHYLR
jgi:hypothetical protein